jgi:type II secretory pathway pseudopilin PulG
VNVGRQEGFSLAEVVVALGLLAGVLISIAGLFVLSGRQLRSGRSSTEALAVARDVIEELDGWGFRRLPVVLGCDPSEAACWADFRDFDAGDEWQSRLEETFRFDPAGPNAPGGVVRLETVDRLPFSTSRTLRVSVEVEWWEGVRRRTVVLTTVRA